MSKNINMVPVDITLTDDFQMDFDEYIDSNNNNIVFHKRKFRDKTNSTVNMLSTKENFETKQLRYSQIFYFLFLIIGVLVFLILIINIFYSISH